MKQIGMANGDFNLSGEIQVFSLVLPAGPDSYALRGEVRLGDGAKNIAGNGVYSLRATLGGVTVFSSDVVVPAGTTRRILDFECWGRAGETLAVLATGLAADVDVDVTTYLYTGVNVVEISEDEGAADALETVLDGTGGAVLKAAQLKLSCNVEDEGALDCQNDHPNGYGQQNQGELAGLRNNGGRYGLDCKGGLVGLSCHGEAAAGIEIITEGEQALTFVGAADRIDDILDDTDVLQTWWADGGRLDLLLDGIPSDVWDEILTAATHNVPTSAGRRLRTIEDMSILATGKARGGTATTIQLEAGSPTEDGAFQYCMIMLAGGTGADPRQPRHSEGYDGSTQTMTIDRAWIGDAPDATTEYIIFAWPRTHVHILDADAVAQVRNAMKLAPSAGAPAAGSVDEHLDDIQAKTDTIGAADLEAVSPVLEDGSIEIVQGDDYLDADGRALVWGETGYTGPIENGDDVEFALMETADYHEAGGKPALTKAGIAHLAGTTLRIVVELTAAETGALDPSPPDDMMNYTYQVRVDVGSSGSGERQVTAALGAATVKKKIIA